MLTDFCGVYIAFRAMSNEIIGTGPFGEKTWESVCPTGGVTQRSTKPIGAGGVTQLVQLLPSTLGVLGSILSQYKLELKAHACNPST